MPVQIKFKATDGFRDKLREATGKAGMEQSAFIRQAIIDYAKKHGVSIEDDMPARGKYARKKSE